MLTVISNDLGNTGAGGALSDTDTIGITINAQNDPPINSVPGTQATLPNTAEVFSTANGNLISISDAESTSAQVTLTAVNGTLTLSTIAGLSFTSGDGTGDTTMTFTGTITGDQHGPERPVVPADHLTSPATAR